MGRFVFELEPVLEMRRREERERQRAVAELERERLELEGEIRSCQRLIDDERRAMRAGLMATGTVDLRGVRMQANASLHLVARAQRAALRLAGTYRKLEAARGVLIEAAARRRAVEQLREARLEAWKLAGRKREDAAIDELAVMRHGRGGDESVAVDGSDAA